MNTIKINPTTSIGFLVGIAAWSMSFITLIWGYVFYRLRAGEWLINYVDETVLTKALVNTGILLVSSWMLHEFLQKRKTVSFIAGLLLGVLFIKAQWDLWMLLLQRGLTLKSSMAGSFLYLLTGFHALHVVVGLGILLPLGFMLSREHGSWKSENRFEFALKFWDLLMLFWLILFILIFVFK